MVTLNRTLSITAVLLSFGLAIGVGSDSFAAKQRVWSVKTYKKRLKSFREKLIGTKDHDFKKLKQQIINDLARTSSDSKFKEKAGLIFGETGVKWKLLIQAANDPDEQAFKVAIRRRSHFDHLIRLIDQVRAERKERGYRGSTKIEVGEPAGLKGQRASAKKVKRFMPSLKAAKQVVEVATRAVTVEDFESYSSFWSKEEKAKLKSLQNSARLEKTDLRRSSVRRNYEDERGGLVVKRWDEVKVAPDHWHRPAYAAEKFGRYGRNELVIYLFYYRNGSVIDIYNYRLVAQEGRFKLKSRSRGWNPNY